MLLRYCRETLGYNYRLLARVCRENGDIESEQGLPECIGVSSIKNFAKSILATPTGLARKILRSIMEQHK